MDRISTLLLLLLLTCFPLTALEPRIADDTEISYRQARDWLDQLPEDERPEQIRDWTVLGLAKILQLDASQLGKFFYDKTPLRDSLFEDLSVQETGPGRRLPDGDGTLYVLVPEDDPHASRTIGLQLDDHRKDAGEDPDHVVVIRYRIVDSESQVILTPAAPQPAAEVRQEHGYIQMPIGTLAQLRSFLASAHHLSEITRRGRVLFAAGWSWPGAPSGKITVDDISALHAGYLKGDREPGFSLDPGPPLSSDPEAAAVELARLLKAAGYDQLEDLENNADIMEFLEFVGPGKSAWQFARYDGGLQGTDVGMTFFYTDVVMKAWSLNLGQGVPTGIIPGFVSDPEATTPPSLCAGAAAEQGRAWLGLRREAVSVAGRKIHLGSTATRVFVKSEAKNGTGEVDPSYGFGRIVYWWDRHYEAVADYEPEYHRLDQIMRWGAAMAWLKNRGHLTKLPAGSVPRPNRGFDSWMSQRSDLKWRMDLPFVSLDKLGDPRIQRALRAAANLEVSLPEFFLTLVSQPYFDCSKSWNVAGGVSAPSRNSLREIARGPGELDSAVRRGGLSAEGTGYRRRRGTFAHLDGRRDTLRMLEGAAHVENESSTNPALSLGKRFAFDTASGKLHRSLVLERSVGRLSQKISVQGEEFARVIASASDRVVSIEVRSGALSSMQRTLVGVEDSLVSGKSLRAAVEEAESVRLAWVSPDAKKLEVQSRDGNWMELAERESLPAKPDLSATLVVPDNGGIGGGIYRARPIRGPPEPGPNNEFLTVDAMRPRRLSFDERVPGDAKAVKVAGAESPFDLFVDRSRLYASSADASRLSEVYDVVANAKAITEARSAASDFPSEFFSTAPLDNGTLAIVSKDQARLVRPGSADYSRVAEASGGGGGKGAGLISFHDGKALSADALRFIYSGRSDVVEYGGLQKHLTEVLVANPTRGPPTQYYLHQRLLERQTPTVGQGVVPPAQRIRVAVADVAPRQADSKLAPGRVVVGKHQFISFDPATNKVKTDINTWDQLEQSARRTSGSGGSSAEGEAATESPHTSGNDAAQPPVPVRRVVLILPEDECDGDSLDCLDYAPAPLLKPEMLATPRFMDSSPAQDITQPISWMPIVYMEEELAAHSLTSKGEVSAVALAQGWQVRMIEVKLADVSPDEVSIPKSFSWDGSHWKLYYSAPAQAALPRRSIRLLFLAGDCDQENGLKRCPGRPQE